MVYASFIEALALLPIFFLEGLTGSFFRPLAFSYALAVLVSLLVALIMTPALSMILFSRARLRRGDAPLVRGLQAVYGRILTPIVRNPVPAFAGGRRHRRRRIRRRTPPRAGAAPELQGARLPDALGHQARHVAGRGGAHHDASREGAAGHPGGAQLRRPHRAGARVGRAGRPRVRGELDQRRSLGALRRDPGQDPGGGRWLPGRSSRRADLSQGAHQRGADRIGRGDRRADLRSGARRAAGEGGRGRGHAAGREGPEGAAHRAADRGAADQRWRSTSRRPSGTGSSPATSGGRPPP